MKLTREDLEFLKRLSVGRSPPEIEPLAERLISAQLVRVDYYSAGPARLTLTEAGRSALERAQIARLV